MDRDFDVIGRYKAIGGKLKRYYTYFFYGNTACIGIIGFHLINYY